MRVLRTFKPIVFSALALSLIGVAIMVASAAKPADAKHLDTTAVTTTNTMGAEPTASTQVTVDGQPVKVKPNGVSQYATGSSQTTVTNSENGGNSDTTQTTTSGTGPVKVTTSKSTSGNATSTSMSTTSINGSGFTSISSSSQQSSQGSN